MRLRPWRYRVTADQRVERATLYINSDTRHTYVMVKLLVDVDEDMLETVRVMLGAKTKKDTVNGALAILIAGQDERVRLGIEAMATHNDRYPPSDRSDAW